MRVLSEQTMDYRTLAGIYAALRAEASRRGIRLRLLEYLEPGPEFCRSEWKTVRHPEVAAARADAGGHEIPGLIDVTLPLNHDPRAYAGWPDGIPAGTLAGEFVARQTAADAQQRQHAAARPLREASAAVLPVQQQKGPRTRF